MPIYAPGHRDRHGRRSGSSKRSAVAVLSLTAMVDMFTVLVVFLLQNYNTTGEVIDISDDVELPQASSTKELKPATVVVLSKKELTMNKEVLMTFTNLKAQESWMIDNLKLRLEQRFKEEEAKKGAALNKIKAAVEESKQGDKKKEEEENDFRRVTLQADKEIDFLTVKKVMFTLTYAGASEINFAVIKTNEEEAAKN